MYSGAYYQAGNKDGERRKTQLRQWRTLWICQYWDCGTKSYLFVWYLRCTHFSLSASEQSNSSINLFGAWARKMKGNAEQMMVIRMEVSVSSVSYKRDQHKYSPLCLFSDMFNSWLIYCLMQYPQNQLLANNVFDQKGKKKPCIDLANWYFDMCQSNITCNPTEGLDLIYACSPVPVLNLKW